ERPEHALHAPCATHREVDEPDEEDRRPETDEEVLPPRRTGLERLRVDGDVLLLEERGEGVRVRERRDLGLEEPRRLCTGVALRNGERSLDRRPLRRDRRDVAVAHLLEEVRAVG